MSETAQEDQHQCMEHEQFVKYLAEQRVEMEKYKWIESEKAGRDLGNSAIMDWIKKYAKRYRDEYIPH